METFWEANAISNHDKSEWFTKASIGMYCWPNVLLLGYLEYWFDIT